MFFVNVRMEPVKRVVLTLLLCVLAVSVLGCGSLDAASADGIRMRMKDYQYAPQTIQARVGETVRVQVRNEDVVAHTFTVQELGINENILARASAVIEFQAQTAGVFKYICLPHPNMVGTIEVKP